MEGGAGCRTEVEVYNWEECLRAYYEKPSSTRTWSGYEVKEFYTPRDLAGKSYEEQIGNPGSFPFTRGIHRNMFRGRYWTRREVIGMGSPADTHERVRLLLEMVAQGSTP